jgi:Rhodopirellula transposase DDE domain
LALIKEHTGGDPMTKQKWVRLSLKRLSRLLGSQGHTIDPVTVRRLLRKWKFSLKANRKRITGPAHPDRDRQFRYIARQKKRFLQAGWPVISVDTKKKELVGNFKNAGQTWCLEAEEVNCHDFPQDASGRAAPYGLYLPGQDRGYVYVGLSADTPEFAVDAIATWWKTSGCRCFRNDRKLLILADSGGSNGCRPRLWKLKLQAVADHYGLEITVCHYPRGASKWNPIEHRLFSYISINWAGKPLRSLEIMLGYIRDTQTETGLKVKATLIPKKYTKGVKVTDQQMRGLRLHRHKTCPAWNYTLRPRADTAGKSESGK